jgi:hypothetical protein
VIPCAICGCDSERGSYNNIPLCLDCYVNRPDDVLAYEKKVRRSMFGICQRCLELVSFTETDVAVVCVNGHITLVNDMPSIMTPQQVAEDMGITMASALNLWESRLPKIVFDEDEEGWDG